MDTLSREQALDKRTDLIEKGYAIIPEVMSMQLLEELRAWSTDVFRRVPVDSKYRYQGSDIHVSTPQVWAENNFQADERKFPDAIVSKILEQPAQSEVCRLIGLEGLRPDGMVIILSKPGHGPPLYWHQDYINWNSPAAATPWPTRIFLSYYLSDTNLENGCLRVIPGSHRKRLDLHDTLPDAHEAQIQAIDDPTHPVFEDRPDAVDVPMKAGDLIIADARLMHGAWPNQTDQRRTLLLAWHHVFPFPKPPTWWEDEIPDVVANADPNATYEPTRTPSHYIT